MSLDAAIALVSLEDAKAFLKLTASSEDTIVSDLVNAVSVSINRYCGRVFLSADYTEFLDGDGSGELILSNFPVTVLTSLNDDPSWRQWQALTAKDVVNDVILEAKTGVVRLWNNGGRFLRGHQNVKAVYTAGYTLDTIPYDVALACKFLVSQFYRQAYSQWRRGIQSEQIQDRNTTFTNDPIPKDIAMMLDPYRVRYGAAH